MMSYVFLDWLNGLIYEKEGKVGFQIRSDRGNLEFSALVFLTTTDLFYIKAQNNSLMFFFYFVL